MVEAVVEDVAEHRRLRRVYRVWAPLYDTIMRPFFRGARKQSIAQLQLASGARLLMVGVGTGLDLPLLQDADVVAFDLTPSMLARARTKAHPRAAFLLADAAHLPFKDAMFDAAILHLVIAVTADARGMLSETLRTLNDRGGASVFDKFAPPHGVSSLRRIINVGVRFIGTDITRSFEEMARGLPAVVERDAPAVGGTYRLILLRKVPRSEERASPARL